MAGGELLLHVCLVGKPLTADRIRMLGFAELDLSLRAGESLYLIRSWTGQAMQARTSTGQRDIEFSLFVVCCFF